MICEHQRLRWESLKTQLEAGGDKVKWALQYFDSNSVEKK